jgi:uncharacterized protein (DUF1778 family)
MKTSPYTELSPQTFRATAEQAALLDQAAKHVRSNKSDLIRIAALQMASDVLAATKH